MFLDDQLLEIGRKAEMTEQGLITATRDMMQACVDNYTKNVPEGSGVLAMKGTIDRLERTWERVANQLNTEGIGFIRPDGLKRYFNYLAENSK